MKIANDQTFKQFDKLKDQMFSHKQKSYQQSQKYKSITNPISFKNRIFFPLLLIGGGLYLTYRNVPSIYQGLLSNGIIDYHQNICLESSICFIKSKLLKENKKGNYNLLNKIYLSKLQGDYTYLTNKGAEKKLSLETSSRYSFWIFSFFNEEKVKLINQYGDLVQRTRISKFMVSDFLRLWGKQKYSLLKRQKLFQTYQSAQNKPDPKKLCQKLNFINQFVNSKQQNQKCLLQCIEQSSKIQLKIKKFINTRLQQQKLIK